MVLGDQQAEDQLLNFAQKNGYNTLMLYGLYRILDSRLNTVFPWNKTNRELELCRFLEKAHKNPKPFRIIAIDGGTFNYVLQFEQKYPSAVHQFDGYNLEFEFWNGGYNGSNIHIAWREYKTLLNMAYQMAVKRNKPLETYIGNILSYLVHPLPNQVSRTEVVETLLKYTHRIHVHIYIDQPEEKNAYEYFKERIFEMYHHAALNQLTVPEIVPIFSYKCNRMGNWFKNHSLDDALKILQDDWKQYAPADYTTYIKFTYRQTETLPANASFDAASVFAYSFTLLNEYCRPDNEEPVNLSRNFGTCNATCSIPYGNRFMHSVFGKKGFTFSLMGTLKSKNQTSSCVASYTTTFLSCNDFAWGLGRDSVTDKKYFFLRWGTQSNGIIYQSQPVVFPAGTCFSTTVSVNDTSICFYKDGIKLTELRLKKPCMLAPLKDNYAIYLGHNPNEKPLADVFRVDNLKVWSEAHSSQQISGADRITQEIAKNKPALVAHWQFDEFAGRVVEDLTEHGFNGMCGDTYMADADGLNIEVACRSYNYNIAKFFDGNDVVRVDRIHAPGNNECTMECWVKPGKPDGTIFEFRSDSGAFALILAAGKPALRWMNKVWPATANIPVDYSACTHLAVRLRRPPELNGMVELTFFINGMADTTYTLNAYSISLISDCAMWWGNDAISIKNNQGYKGDLDQVRLWRYARGNEQIKNNYDKLIRGQTAWFIGYWRCDELGTQWLEDKSTSNHVATRGLLTEEDEHDPSDIISCSPVKFAY